MTPKGHFEINLKLINIKVGNLLILALNFVVVHRIYNFGCRVNEDIPRDDKESKKWGLFPREYNGYDMQYFLGTLEPVLENVQGPR